MLAVSPLSNTSNKDEDQRPMESFSINAEEFPDFSDGNLLESIDFDDLFVGMSDGDVLPDLEMDPEILADFSVSGSEESEMNISPSVEKAEDCGRKEDEDKVSASSSSNGDETASKREDGIAARIPGKDGNKGRKSSPQGRNNNQGKRKVKVDWTPELHRRFVQAVEQLGVDKAVPSRILELMGIDCLTRHNIASHLQKYRSHRKHLLAREAEAASWSQRRQVYGTGGAGKRDVSPWLAPTMGFPPITPMHHHFRPLHVWGHPSLDQSILQMWPKHLPYSPSRSPPPPPPPTWAPSLAPPPPQDPSFWQHHPQRVRNGLSPGTPCFAQAIGPTRFGAAAVPGIPPHPAMYKAEAGIGVPTAQTGPHSVTDFHPSKESIDAAIGDVLSKPWLPLPLGLKPPSIDSVLVELQRQGVPKVPPSCA